ncbi:MAG: DUF2058 family protein [Xanthomonadales bacterium]|nr:DUF2058 family protein [Xanthomonadales bacterium]
MSGSLKDQLIELGLAKEKPRPKRAKPKGRKRKSKPSGEGGLSLDQAYRLRAQQEKQAAHQKKEEKRLKDLENRRINKEIQALVDAHKLNDPKAELKRNFMYKGRIRSVLVTEAQLKALNAGDLGVVFLRGGYFVMAPEHVAAAKAISADHVPDLGGAEPDDDDEDERFKVPDDLVW